MDKEESWHITPCVSAGILVREDSKEVELCLSLAGKEMKHLCIAIPKVAIKRIRTLRVS